MKRYFSYFYCDTNNNFKSGTKFEHIYSLFLFDTELKNIFLKQLLDVEKIIKNSFAFNIEQHYGNDTDDFFHIKHFDLGKRNTPLIYVQIEREIESIRKIYKLRNVSAYTLFDNITFGKSLKYYDHLLGKTKEAIKDYFNFSFDIKTKELKTYIELLIFARNKCAHNDLFIDFFNKRIKIPLNEIHSQCKLDLDINGDPINGRKDLLALLISIKLFMPKEEFRTFITRVNALIDDLVSKTILTRDVILGILKLPKDFMKVQNV